MGQSQDLDLAMKMKKSTSMLEAGAEAAARVLNLNCRLMGEIREMVRGKPRQYANGKKRDKLPAPAGGGPVASDMAMDGDR